MLDRVQQYDKDYSGRKLSHFVTVGCRLEGCRFVKASVENAQFGGGRIPSEFVDCNFNDSSVDMGPGGYARFVGCSFRNVDLRNWTCFTVELIDCVFSGRLRKGIFNGAVPKAQRTLLGRVCNDIRGNDFSAMELIDVSFRTGVDLTKQRLPSGASYIYLPDAAIAVERTRSVLASLNDGSLRRSALTILEVFDREISEGQRQLLLREDDYYRYSALSREAVSEVFSLLRGNAN